MTTNTTLLIKDIHTLVVVPPGPLAGLEMRNIPIIENAALRNKKRRRIRKTARAEARGSSRYPAG